MINYAVHQPNLIMEDKQIITMVLETLGPILDVEYDYLEGDYQMVKTELFQKVELIFKKYQMIKIGKSSTPHIRFKQEYKPAGFLKLIAVYKSESAKDIETAEEELIDKYIDELMVLNINGGSGGDLGEAPHYVYVAVSQEHLTMGTFDMYKNKVESVMNKMKRQIKDALQAQVS